MAVTRVADGESIIVLVALATPPSADGVTSLLKDAVGNSR
jgi:hypothetical protein